MSTVAELLRSAREEQKLNIYQIAEITKIKTDHIRALEAGRYDTFAAPVYIRGFVRTYAKALKLDAVQLSDALEAELGQTKKFREPLALSKEPRSVLDVVLLRLAQLKWQRWAPVLGLMLIVLGGVAAFRSCQTTQKPDPLKKLGPGLYRPPQSSNTGDLLPVPSR